MSLWFVKARRALLTTAVLSVLCGLAHAQQKAVPRTTDGKPDLQGIWQAAGNIGSDLEKGAAEGGKIPYLPAAAAKKAANFASRKTADPLGKCYMPGVPRIMYAGYPFQIFQTPAHVAIAYEWSQVYRLIYTDGKPAPHEIVDSWMGDSRGHWDGDTLVVDVKGQNDKTWLDAAGNLHSDVLHVTERYTLRDADTIQYEATMEDAKTYSKPWKISFALTRRKNVDRLMEYQCQAEVEEANGLFERDPRTWYPKPGAPPSAPAALPPSGPVAAVKAGANLRRTADGKPDLTGYYQSNAGGANYGLEKHARDAFTPATRGVVIDPPDNLLPYQPWARAERINRELPYRGYDDPTAHCFVAGVPRSIYVPSPFQIVQTPNYIVMLHERMAWRIVPLDGRAHIPDNIRLWQGDSVGHWEGDTLVIETTNMNGKTWLNEVGDVVSHAERIVERFTPTDLTKITYRATVTDPIVYTKPWTIEIPLTRDPKEELLEVACHEDNGDLQHLKDVRDEYRAQQKKEKK
jgi:hypothetical protein